MGQYINKTSKTALGSGFFQKLGGIVQDGGKVIPTPKKWEEGLVCIIDNGLFAAAGYAYDEKEMNAFINGMSGRNYTWLLWDKAKDYAE